MGDGLRVERHDRAPDRSLKREPVGSVIRADVDYRENVGV